MIAVSSTNDRPPCLIQNYSPAWQLGTGLPMRTSCRESSISAWATHTGSIPVGASRRAILKDEAGSSDSPWGNSISEINKLGDNERHVVVWRSVPKLGDLLLDAIG